MTRVREQRDERLIHVWFVLQSWRCSQGSAASHQFVTNLSPTTSLVSVGEGIGHTEGLISRDGAVLGAVDGNERVMAQ